MKTLKEYRDLVKTMKMDKTEREHFAGRKLSYDDWLRKTVEDYGIVLMIEKPSVRRAKAIKGLLPKGFFPNANYIEKFDFATGDMWDKAGSQR